MYQASPKAYPKRRVNNLQTQKEAFLHIKQGTVASYQQSLAITNAHNLTLI